MCGLAGVVSLDGQLAPEAGATAQSMADTLVHRGPDATGAWSDRVVALAFRRLSILDVTEAGSQPMLSGSGRLVAVFNGEIYNYRELGDKLRSQGWRSRGRSDTEVLLAAVESWGLDRFLEVADGMFAFALYDRRDTRLVLARDRFGEKPLVYGVHKNQLYFASELRAFSRIPGFDLSLDHSVTANYFRFGYVPGRDTIYSSILRLEPASVLEIDLKAPNGLKQRRYWKVRSPFETPVPRSSSRNEELLEQLSLSVRNRLVSDRPVGAFLSGGIDSSLVCALAARHATGALKTFTMGWEEGEYDESRQAARVASALGADHHDVRLHRSDVVAAVTQLGSVMDEPFADSSQLAVRLVASQAREHVVVALSGDGGDELFAGYNRHRWLLAARPIRQRLPNWMLQLAARLVHRAAPGIGKVLRPIPTTHRPRLLADKARKFAAVLAAPSLTGSYQQLLAQDASFGRPRQLPENVCAALEEGGRDGVLWALRSADLGGYLADDVLTKVDRATMSVSLESRTPFLQPDLVELALALGPDEVLGRSGGKQPLRAMLRALLPSVNFDQPKFGFGVPIADLLRTDLRALLSDAVATHVARHPPVAPEWSALCARLDRGDDSSAPMLWSLLMFELWAAEVQHPISWR